MLKFLICIILIEEEKQRRRKVFGGGSETKDRLRISKRFKKQRGFLLELLKDPGSRFNELIDFGFEEASTALMYFGLGSCANQPKSQKKLAEEFGICRCMVCLRVNAMLIYLGYADGEIEKCSSLKRSAKGIRTRVIRERRKRLANKQTDSKKDAIERKKEMLAKSLELPHLPVGMPIERFEDLKLVLEALRSKKLDESYPKHKSILLRFGLISPDGQQDLCYRSLRKLKEISKNCVLTITKWEGEVLAKLRQ
jgi:hypothetical protein